MWYSSDIEFEAKSAPTGDYQGTHGDLWPWKGRSIGSSWPSRASAYKPATLTASKPCLCATASSSLPERFHVTLHKVCRFRFQRLKPPERLSLQLAQLSCYCIGKLVFTQLPISLLTEWFSFLPPDKSSIILWPYRTSCLYHSSENYTINLWHTASGPFFFFFHVPASHFLTMYFCLLGLKAFKHFPWQY